MNPTLLAIALLCFLATGCKQGAGERCQVNSDCASNICSSSPPQVCVNSDEDQDQAPIDATVPIDAPIDASIDASIDGP